MQNIIVSVTNNMQKDDNNLYCGIWKYKDHKDDLGIRHLLWCKCLPFSLQGSIPDWLMSHDYDLSCLQKITKCFCGVAKGCIRSSV